MYSVNTLSTPVLITPDECMKLFAGTNLDPNIWSSAIQIGEERFIRPLLGDAFYNDLATQKNVLLTSGNLASNQALITAQNGANAQTLVIGWYFNALEFFTTSGYADLWNSCLCKLCYEAVCFVALPENYAKLTNQGVIKNNPSPSLIDGSASGTSAGIGLRDLKYLRDDLLFQRVSIMEDATRNYIYNNASLYPLFPQKTFDEMSERNKPSSRKTAFIDIYEDKDRRFEGGRDYENW